MNPLHLTLAAELKQHTGKLITTWALGMTTWVAEVDRWIVIDKWIARLGLWAGAAAALMLVVIRWDDLVKSGPVGRLKARLGRLAASVRRIFK